jgi:hypothetical protein
VSPPPPPPPLVLHNNARTYAQLSTLPFPFANPQNLTSAKHPHTFQTVYYTWNLETSLYMLEPWERFVFNGVVVASIVGATLYVRKVTGAF